MTRRLFQLRVDGVNVTFRHRDAVDEALRESTRRVRELWQFRDGINAGDVVKAEMPAVEKKNVQLLLQMSADRKKVAELEADILKRLSEAQGNILDDEDLINTLAESKKVSIMIGKRMEAAVVTKQEIDEAREAYRTVATRGSIIYFVIADMAQIDPMYQCDRGVPGPF